MAAKLTIQIVGWNSANVLPETLAALRSIPRDEAHILYIDNASEDASVRLVREVLPQAAVIELPENRGFSGAHNAGLTSCQTPYVLTHDPDLVLDWNGVKELLRAFDDSKVGAVQGKLYRVSKQVSSKGINIIDSAGIVHTLALNGKERGANQEDAGQFEQEVRLLAVTGACGLYRRAALKSVAHGGTEFFDEDFFAYKEDVDLGWRLNKAGWKVLYRPVLMGRHRRTLGRRGVLGWSLSPRVVYRRLKDTRTRLSMRNWMWMVAKNVSLKQILVHEVFIDLRLAVFVLFSFIYWPLLRVWPEIRRGLPRMLKKRTKQTPGV